MLGLPLTEAARSSDLPPRSFNPRNQTWRKFEVTTSVFIPQPHGSVQLWLPVPSIDSDWQRTQNHSWTSNATQTQFITDPLTGARLLHAVFHTPGVPPQLHFTSSVRTRDRAIDWDAPRTHEESRRVLERALTSTPFRPTDGIVRTTARQATHGAQNDFEKVRALYQWVLTHAHREPKTRGCGLGDIKTMLETGDLSGKCADLNALFVGLCRASGVPARELYGLRLAPSAFGYRELGARSASLTTAQHCRAEVFLNQYGWVPMDPADVLKVMRQETNEWLRDPEHPLVAPVARGLFGRWEGNWLAWNSAHGLPLIGSQDTDPLPFLMYPHGEDERGRFDELAPDTFRYTIHAVEL